MKKSSGDGWALSRGCPGCGRDPRECRCPALPTPPLGKPTFRLRLERRRGKPVTVLASTAVPAEELTALAREAKASCGAGGTVKATEIEIQGDQRERLRVFLGAQGYTVKG